MGLIHIARPWTNQPQVSAQQNWSHPLSSGLLVRVLGTGIAGGPAFPSIGSVSGISGVITGGSRHVSERGLAWSMAGGTDRVNLGASTAIKTPATTVSGWFRPSSLSNAYSGLVSSYDDGAGRYRSLFVKSSGKLAVYIAGGATASFDGTGAATLAVGTWYHVAYTWSPASGLVAYVNAQVDGTVSASGSLLADVGDTHIGADMFAPSSRQFVGAWQNVRIYNRALSQAELRALYENEYQDLGPQQIMIPVSAGAGGGLPTLSNARATSITTTGAVPLVDYAY